MEQRLLYVGRWWLKNIGRWPKTKRSGQNVQPACGQADVSDWQTVCSSSAPPAVQRGNVLSIWGAADNLEGQLHAEIR